MRVALEQLESALKLYSEGTAYFSVITLAGAAEEIIGKRAKANGHENSQDRLKRAGAEIQRRMFGKEAPEKKFADRANYARNKLKHLNPGVEPHVTLDAEEEARDMLTRAIDNYWLVENALTPAMEKFERERREA